MLSRQKAILRLGENLRLEIRNLKLLSVVFICLLFLSGCSSSNFSINLITDELGNIVVEHQIDIGLAEKIRQLTPGYQIAQEEMQKRYFILYSDYDLNIKILTSGKDAPKLPSNFPVNVKFIVTFPGKIKNTTAKEIQGQKAIWLIKPGEVLDIKLSSRQWHLKQLIIFGGLILYIIYQLFLRRKDEKI